LNKKNNFRDDLIRVSRKKWLNIDNLEMSICFFVDSSTEEDIGRVVNNIKLFLKYKYIDIILVDISEKNSHFDFLKDYIDLHNFKYVKIEGGFQPEKISSLLSVKNIIVGISSDILLNENFLEYIDSHLLDSMTFLGIQNNNSILFVTSRDILSVYSSYGNDSLLSIKKHDIPHDMFDILGNKDFKEESFLDFKAFDRDGEIIDLDNNQIINGMWIGDSLSNVEKLSINSFLKNGHDYHLYVYDDIKGIPEGVIVKDANTIIDSSKIFRYKKMGKREGSEVGNEGFAGFSDWFRYVLLRKEGGWWSDLDSICLKKFDIPRPYVFATHKGVGSFITNGIIKVPKNSLVMSFCANRCEEEGDNVGWMKTGPILLYKGYINYNLMKFSITEEVFELFRSGSNLFKDKELDLEDSYSVHMYNSELSMKGWDKNGVYPENSLFEKLKRKYL